MDWRRNQERNQIKKWLVSPIIHMPLLHHWACLIGPLIIAPCRVLSCIRLVIPFLLVASLAPSSTMGINQEGWHLLLRLTIRISLVSSLESSPFFFPLCLITAPSGFCSGCEPHFCPKASRHLTDRLLWKETQHRKTHIKFKMRQSCQMSKQWQLLEGGCEVGFGSTGTSELVPHW